MKRAENQERAIEHPAPLGAPPIPLHQYPFEAINDHKQQI